MKLEFTSQSFVRVVFELLALGIVVGARCQIARSQAEVRAYHKEQPCPSTGKARGACPGYQVDHVIPRRAGGADHRGNMHWLSVEDHRWKKRNGGTSEFRNSRQADLRGATAHAGFGLYPRSCKVVARRRATMRRIGRDRMTAQLACMHEHAGLSLTNVHARFCDGL